MSCLPVCSPAVELTYSASCPSLKLQTATHLLYRHGVMSCLSSFNGCLWGSCAKHSWSLSLPLSVVKRSGLNRTSAPIQIYNGKLSSAFLKPFFGPFSKACFSRWGNTRHLMCFRSRRNEGQRQVWYTCVGSRGEPGAAVRSSQISNFSSRSGRIDKRDGERGTSNK